MKNYVSDGNTITITAPEALTSGDGVKIGLLFGVATADALSGAEAVIQRKGVVNIAKVSAQAWAVGDLIYWDEGNDLATTASATGLINIGIATAVAANPSSTGEMVISEGIPTEVA